MPASQGRAGRGTAHRQAQRQQLPDEHLVLKISLELAQFAAVPQHQQAEFVHLGQCKAHGIGVVQNVGAMLVVVAV